MRADYFSCLYLFIYMPSCPSLPSSPLFLNISHDRTLYCVFMDFELASLSLGHLAGLINWLGVLKLHVPFAYWFSCFFMLFGTAAGFLLDAHLYWVTYVYLACFDYFAWRRISCLLQPPHVVEDILACSGHLERRGYFSCLFPSPCVMERVELHVGCHLANFQVMFSCSCFLA